MSDFPTPTAPGVYPCQSCGRPFEFATQAVLCQFLDESEAGGKSASRWSHDLQPPDVILGRKA